MAYLTEVAEWIESIYQLETDDLVLGGPDGIDNVQARELACRTLFLKLKKADIDSPNFTGEPTAPTPSSADDGSRIATVEYVSNANKSTVFSFNEIPIAKSSDVIYVKGKGNLEWTTIGSWTGYASLLLGAFIFDTTTIARSQTIDAIGGTYKKSLYPALWAWANAQNKVVSAASWKAGTYFFVDLGGDDFRAPDIRNMFIRGTGTDADNANARVLGSYCVLVGDDPRCKSSVFAARLRFWSATI
ncbi:Uncharacterised protein [Oligella ureolytica]|uniref:hypothetical protein n=1 Tax=Oligella ureolytica TaxID=90244 RepID=UPI000DFEDA8E|nr:hypothetical protein [Oligella ureolytica]SUA58105.1 Uncharacterised protein [Oligella ureolytica]